MEKFSNVKYIDAKYTHEIVGLSDIALDHHEAYGKLSTNSSGDYILEYVITDNPDFQNKIMEGLIMPKESLTSEYTKQEHKIKCNLENINIGDKIEINWKDIVHIVDSTQRECSVMYTEGILHTYGRSGG